MEEIIKTVHLTKIYHLDNLNRKTKAIDDVNLSIHKGAFVGIMGKSGSGKTTLIHLLSTIDEPTQGKIFINGKNTSTLSESQKAFFRKKYIGFIFQDFNLLDSLTIQDNIYLSLRLNKIKIEEKKEEIERITNELEIDDIMDKYPFECSGGQKQRAAIARALVSGPSLLFCDEPTGNLDSIRSKQLMEYLRDMNQKYHVTIVMVTHDCLVAAYSSELYYVEDGKITHHIEKGTASFEEYYSQIAKISMDISL